MKAPDDHCPCGCGERTRPPINVHSVWHLKDPYWAWRCIASGCKRQAVEQHNQSGDPICPWCSHQRIFVGHFLSGGAQEGYRTTVLGKKIPNSRRAGRPDLYSPTA